MKSVIIIIVIVAILIFVLWYNGILFNSRQRPLLSSSQPKQLEYKEDSIVTSTNFIQKLEINTKQVMEGLVNVKWKNISEAKAYGIYIKHEDYDMQFMIKSKEEIIDINIEYYPNYKSYIWIYTDKGITEPKYFIG